MIMPLKLQMGQNEMIRFHAILKIVYSFPTIFAGMDEPEPLDATNGYVTTNSFLDKCKYAFLKSFFSLHTFI